MADVKVTDNTEAYIDAVGAECIAEVEVLLSRGAEVPKCYFKGLDK